MANREHKAYPYIRETSIHPPEVALAERFRNRPPRDSVVANVTPLNRRMTETRTSCMKCNNLISTRTAEKNGGLCAICMRDANRLSNSQILQPLPSKAIPFDVEPDTSSLIAGGKVKWNVAEDILVDLASQYLHLFADVNFKKQFYGIALDCNADYGQVFLCANSPQHLAVRTAEYKRDSPHLWDNMTLAEVQDHLRWALGDWEFNAMTTASFSNHWESVADILTDSIDWDSDDGIEQFRADFMHAACRAMLRLEVDGILDLVPQTDDFRSFVADHDESEVESWARYNACREQQSHG